MQFSLIALCHQNNSISHECGALPDLNCDWHWKACITYLAQPPSFVFLHFASSSLCKLCPFSQSMCSTCLQVQYGFLPFSPREICGMSISVILNQFVLVLTMFVVSISVRGLYIRSWIHYSALNYRLDSTIRVIPPSKRLRLNSDCKYTKLDYRNRPVTFRKDVETTRHG